MRGINFRNRRKKKSRKHSKHPGAQTQNWSCNTNTAHTLTSAAHSVSRYGERLKKKEKENCNKQTQAQNKVSATQTHKNSTHTRVSGDCGELQEEKKKKQSNSHRNTSTRQAALQHKLTKTTHARPPSATHNPTGVGGLRQDGGAR